MVPNVPATSPRSRRGNDRVVPAPTSHPTGYATPAALWAAVRARVAAEAKASGLLPANVLRQFVYDRFLARVFHTPGNGWVLKGGTALLARVRSARHSKDIDLFLTEGTLDTAIAELQAAAGLDLHDHLGFVVSGLPKRSTERLNQPGSELVTIHVDAYAGVKKVQEFTVDVVIGSTITQDPELLAPEPLIIIPGIESPTYQLYPVVDHIADKLCATVELHAGKPSGRIRDLVDLVVIARTQHVDAAALHHAIRSEQHHRQLAPIDRWHCPDTWETDYPRWARDVAECGEHRTFAAATALMSEFFDRVLAGELDQRHRWSATSRRWEAGPLQA